MLGVTAITRKKSVCFVNQNDAEA
jgi:hypothetical protein